MRKKISILLCVAAAMLCFTGCGSSKETVEYDEASLEQTAEFMIEYCASMDASTLEQWKEMQDFTLELQLMQSGLPVTSDGFLEALDGWVSSTEDCGEYLGHGDFVIEPSADEIKVSTTAQFAERDAEINFVFNETSYMESMSLSPEYTKGEIFKKAGMNTILGMGTVFVVLIFISFLISLFKYIPALEEKFKKRPKEEAKQADAPVQAPLAAIVPEDVPADDSELIAVIAAAIAAAQADAQGTDGIDGVDGFVVRSIRRRPSNKWKA